MPETKNKQAEDFARCRAETGLSAAAFGRVVGIGGRHVFSIESGERGASAAILFRAQIAANLAQGREPLRGTDLRQALEFERSLIWGRG